MLPRSTIRHLPPRPRLPDARLGKKAARRTDDGRDAETAQERIQDLRDAVKDAKATGLSEEEMASAVAVLEQLMMEVLARSDLAEAMQLATIDALKPAIENARAAGIDAEELIPAQTQLENAYKPTARAKLKEAVLTRDIPSILAAIEQGKAVGLSVMAIAEAIGAALRQPKSARTQGCHQLGTDQRPQGRTERCTSAGPGA
ncbi:unnamed protein product [Cladocopium goreaui]|uniref:Uncharacterized protein n=1 Tax=Cladocopium goreaui TaxID=2562237 RepID=A0A9P1BTD8_9DINO|nr:unnamed protein product [Cladocopium goreaui]